MASLTEIMNKHGSDKGSGHHNFTDYYEMLFEPMRERKMNILEIGIGSINRNFPSSMVGVSGYKPGASLRGWREYFPNATIYGADIDPATMIDGEERIVTFLLDQGSEESLRKTITDREVVFDIIIDDGLHNFPINWKVMQTIFSRLSPDGYYIIEDVMPQEYLKTKLSGDFYKTVNMRYLAIPNPQNNADNNLVIGRHKPHTIPPIPDDYLKIPPTPFTEEESNMIREFLGTLGKRKGIAKPSFQNLSKLLDTLLKLCTAEMPQCSESPAS